MKLLVTGGAGFIGSAFVRLTLSKNRGDVLVVDKLTYAGNLENLESVAAHPGYRFVQGDICDSVMIDSLVAEYKPDAIIHFAAESHVDRSILSPEPVFEANLRGTFILLEAARRHSISRFLHISTDEVYGSLNSPLEASEEFPIQASSPYSATKAGSDLLALSYWRTYRLPVIVTRASNNYGPYQFPEKLIPLMVSNAMENRPVPIYGDGKQVRDWLYVDDHCEAIHAVLARGRNGEVYNIGGSRSLPNIDVVRAILRGVGRQESLMEYVADRPGHDRRYALSSAKLMRETGWKPKMDFEQGLGATISWYRENRAWLERVKSGEYRTYYERNYASRGVSTL
jgi:dTDP-glucose 4,6-dehydratase